MSQEIIANTNTNANTNDLINDVQTLHRMSLEKDNLLINITAKLINLEDQMKHLSEQNNNLKYEISRLMAYFISFSVDVKNDLHHIKYK
jgi:hypothetical protein